MKLLRSTYQGLRWDSVIGVLGQDCAQETL